MLTGECGLGIERDHLRLLDCIRCHTEHGFDPQSSRYIHRQVCLLLLKISDMLMALVVTVQVHCCDKTTPILETQSEQQ